MDARGQKPPERGEWRARNRLDSDVCLCFAFFSPPRARPNEVRKCSVVQYSEIDMSYSTADASLVKVDREVHNKLYKKEQLNNPT